MTTKPENSENSASLAEVGDKASALHQRPISARLD